MNRSIDILVQTTYGNALILALVIFLTWGVTLTNGYSFDDNFIAKGNQQIAGGIHSLPEIFTTPYIQNENLTVEYRPLVKATFAVEYSLWAFSPRRSHAVQLILMWICAWLFYLVSFKILKKQRIPALIAVCIFIVHPMQSEVVASLKNRDVILAAISVFSVLYFFIRYCETGKLIYIPVLVLLFILGLLSKLAAAPVALCLPLLGLAGIDGFKLRKSLSIAFVLILLTVLYFYIIQSFIPGALSRKVEFFENPMVDDSSVFNRIRFGMITLFYYLKLTILPYPWRFYYGYNTVTGSFLQIEVLAGLLVFLFIGYLLYRYKTQKLFIFSIFSYVLMLSVFANVAIITTGIVAERNLFIPIAFIAIPPAFLSTRKSIRFGLIAVILVCMVMCNYRALQWKSLISLLKADSVHVNESWFGSYLYANQLFVEAGENKKNLKQKDVNEIIKFTDNAIRLYNGKPEPYYLNGRVYDEVLNNQTLAANYFLNAALLDSTNSEYTFRAARALQLTDRLTDAARWYRRTIRIFPGSMYSYYYLSQIEYNNKNVASAYTICGEMIRLFPDSYLPYLNLGVFRFSEGNVDLSAEMYATAVDKGFRDTEILQALVEHYTLKGDSEKSSQYLRYINQ